MNAKNYRAETMSQALAEVKRDLGRDAVILHTRCIRKGGFLRLLGGRRIWEVTASPNVNVPDRAPTGQYVCDNPDARRPKAPAKPIPPPQPPAPATEGMAQEMSELRRLVQALVDRQPDSAPATAAAPGELERFRRVLLDQDVDEGLADALLDQVHAGLPDEQREDADLIYARLCQLIADRIGPAAPADSSPARVVALIGPTGVGKTTTVAKLAANAKLRRHKKVGLLTLDTYRIAAVDQLRTYAEIINVPLQAVLTPEELGQAVREFRQLDLILIDTAGRSQNDDRRLSQLRAFLEAARADEVHLLLSATASPRCARGVLDKFGTLGANRLILTKLDEVETMGAVLNVAAAATTPLSYVTTGQDVPDDIETPDPYQLAEQIMGEALHVA